MNHAEVPNRVPIAWSPAGQNVMFDRPIPSLSLGELKPLRPDGRQPATYTGWQSGQVLPMSLAVAMPASSDISPANLTIYADFCSQLTFIGLGHAAEREQFSPIGKQGECATIVTRPKLIHSDPVSHLISQGTKHDTVLFG
jgi:hypothetical protein